MLREHLGGNVYAATTPLSQDTVRNDKRAGLSIETDEQEAVELRPPQQLGMAIDDVLAYRWSKGNHQWQVRWHGEDPRELSWETWGVLDTPELRARAEALRLRCTPQNT